MSDLKPSTRALLELGRLGDDPTAAAVGQNRRALARKLGVAALGAGAVAGSTTTATAAATVSAGSAATAAATVSAGSAATLKLALLCGAVLLGGAVTWKVVDSRPATERDGKSLALPALAPQRDASVVPPSAAAAVEPPVAPSTTASSTPTPTDLAAPSEPSASGPHVSPVRPASARSIKEELELVRAAQQALNRGDPQAALALLAEHAQKFPAGVLWQDREASRVFALCRLGNAAGARALADAFVRRAPKSPFVDRVRGACREPAPASSASSR